MEFIINVKLTGNGKNFSGEPSAITFLPQTFYAIFIAVNPKCTDKTVIILHEYTMVS